MGSHAVKLKVTALTKSPPEIIKSLFDLPLSTYPPDEQSSVEML